AGERGRHRIAPAAERFAEDQEIRYGAGLVLVREQLAGPAEARLNLVEHEQHVALAAERARRGEIAVGRQDDSCLGLDGLDEKRGRVGAKRGAQLLDVAEVDEPKTGGGAAEVLAVL